MSVCVVLPQNKIDIRDFEQITTAGADTAAGSKFPLK